MEIFTRDFEVGLGTRNEDGAPEFAIVWQVVGELATGTRIAHNVTFSTEARAVALAVKVRAHLAKGGAVDMAHWEFVDPAYGSAAYQELDAVGFFKAAEAQREAEGLTIFNDISHIG